MKTITGVLIGLGVGVGALFVLYGFIFLKVNNNNTNTITLNQEIYLESEKQIRTMETKRSVTESAALLKQVSDLFVETDKIPDFLGIVESFASKTKTVVVVRDVSRSVPSSLVSSSTEFLVVSVSSRGRFQGVYQFLRLIETLPYGVYVDSVSLSQGGFVGGAGSQGGNSSRVPEWLGDISFRLAIKKSIK